MMDPIIPETGSDDWSSKNGKQNQQVLKFNEYWILNMFFKHKCMLKCYLVIEFSYQYIYIYNHQSQSVLLQHCPNVSSATNAIEVSLKYHWRILHYHECKHILKQWEKNTWAKHTHEASGFLVSSTLFSNVSSLNCKAQHIHDTRLQFKVSVQYWHWILQLSISNLFNATIKSLWESEPTSNPKSSSS